MVIRLPFSTLDISLGLLQSKLEIAIKRPLQDYELNVDLTDLPIYDSMAALSFFLLITEELDVTLSMEEFLDSSNLIELLDLLKSKT